MIALKIMASGSWYLAVDVRIGQSNMSTELLLNKGGRLVLSRSGSHTPASTGKEPPTPVDAVELLPPEPVDAVELSPPPLQPVVASRPAPSTAASIDHRDLVRVGASSQSMGPDYLASALGRQSGAASSGVQAAPRISSSLAV